MSVIPGISKKEGIEQSNCFAFKEGKVYTFNDETSCSSPVGLDIEGAVLAGPVVSILERLPEDEIEISQKGKELIITGKRKDAHIAMSQTVTLPYDSIDLPTKWDRLPENFLDAIKMVHQCASTDESSFVFTCVHIHPKWIEACDDLQIARYRLVTGVDAPVLVRNTSIRHLTGIEPGLEPTKFFNGRNWIHFKNKKGWTISCRKYLDEYKDISSFMKIEGIETSFPKGISEALDRAEIFSADNELNLVRVEIGDGRIKVRGQGRLGWYNEFRKIDYNEKPVIFYINPGLLKDISSRHNEVIVSDTRIKVKLENYAYITVMMDSKEYEDHKSSVNGEKKDKSSKLRPSKE